MKWIRSHLGRLASIGFSLLAIIYLLLRVEWVEVLATLAGANWAWLALAFLVYMANYVLRTLRFGHFLFSRKVPFRRLFGVTSLHGMLNYMLPVRSGEISYPLLLNRRFEVPLAEGVSGLLVSRALDFLTIATLLPLVLLLFWDEFPLLLNLVVLAFSVLVVLFVLVGYRLLDSGWPEPIGDAADHSGTISGQLRRWPARLAQALKLVRTQGRFWYLAGLTVGVWLAVYTGFYLIVLSLGYSVDFLHMVVVSIVMVPTTLLPVQGLANLGTHEIGWVAALSLFGYAEGLSLQIAVGSHSVLILFVVLLAGASSLVSVAGGRLPEGTGRVA